MKSTDTKKHSLRVFDNSDADINLGFLWNHLISESKDPYVCLLNSDTEVEPGWLDRMEEVAQSTGACAVGPMTNRCGINYQVGDRGEGIREVPTLSGFCTLIRKDSWHSSGGFRTDFPFYGQESNLMDRLQKKVVAQDVFIRHEAGASIKATDRQPEEKQWGMESYQRNKRFDWKQRLLIIGSTDYSFPLWKGVRLALQEFRREGMPVLNVSSDLETEDVLSAIEFAPTFVLHIGTNLYRMQRVVRLLKQFPKVPKALWWNDLRPAPDGIKGVFDGIFLCWRKTYQQFDLLEWQEKTGSRIYYMPQGSFLNPRLKKRRLKRDLVFIGDVHNTHYHSDRSQITQFLRAMVINENARNKRIEVERKSEDIYRESKFCLAISPPVPGYNSLRLYNIMACGGLALVRDFPGLHSLMKSGRHCLRFRTKEEAREIMGGIDSDTRDEIRTRGWRLQQAKHTVGNRIMNIMENLSGSDQTFWGFV